MAEKFVGSASKDIAGCVQTGSPPDVVASEAPCCH